MSNKPERFRIFYAPQVFRTWEKVFILLDTGHLHCQYLDRFNISFIDKKNFDYTQFRPNDFMWGEGVKGDKGVAFANYQECEKELSWHEYKNLAPSDRLSGYSHSNINDQIRWLEGYISMQGLTEKSWDDRFLKAESKLKWREES